METSLQEGDAPQARDLLLEHYRDHSLEVEGKLGRRSIHKFSAGVGVEQFEAVEARLLSGAPGLGLTSGAPTEEHIVDLFYDQEASLEEGLPQSRRRWKEAPKLRLSFACDEAGKPHGEPLEALRKTRIFDCHIGRPTGDGAPPENAHVDVRVSYSREVPVPADDARADAAVVYTRRKRRRTFEASLYRVQLTRVDVAEVGPGVSKEPEEANLDIRATSSTTSVSREVFEVEVELRMDAVRPRLEAATNAAEEALCITRELVGALRCLARWAVEARACKRKRLEGFHAAEPALRAALEEPEVRAELARLAQQAGGEPTASLTKAKHYLFNLLKERHTAVNESALFHFAGKQVARLFRAATAAREQQEQQEQNGQQDAPPAAEHIIT